ncbi:hypothetical protein [Candidatus Bodocaedibacter vickermanii]|uniref:Secreted RxLR effector peptide protein n=1 Tax=Candidatus Bodocaedibacter vickermanii TaxID=2741701 RepID=A0A7L9RUW5_9PROT|nr:hypothetical protein CPBP_01133 [Candidatus Paracaedibacteraceae bacterium 'Lake Konstanz']
MSISKLLMTAALCTISMAASTSYGSAATAADAAATDDDRRPSQRSFVDLGSLTRLDLTTPTRHRERDNMSVGSTVSTISHDRLAPALKILADLLRGLPREVAFPGGKVNTLVPGKPTQLDIILTGYTNFVGAYKGLLLIAEEGKQDQASLARVLARAKDKEVAKVDVRAESVEGQILAAIEAKDSALKTAEEKVVKAETSKTTWKVGAFITSGVLAAIASVLVNVIRVHGWEIILGSGK